LQGKKELESPQESPGALTGPERGRYTGVKEWGARKRKNSGKKSLATKRRQKGAPRSMGGRGRWIRKRITYEGHP